MTGYFRPITPKRLTHERIENALKEVRKALRDDFEPQVIAELAEMTSNWQHQPTFKARHSAGVGGIEVVFNPIDNEAGRIFKWVDQGTDPHTIEGNPLHFVGSVPKTRARGGQRARKIAPGQEVFAQSVSHPGIQPRKFIERRKARLQAIFRRTVENALRRGLRG